MSWLHTHHPDVIVGTTTAGLVAFATGDHLVTVAGALLTVASAVASALASTYLRFRLEQAAKRQGSTP